MLFSPLDESKNPEDGLFFFESGDYPGPAGCKATGMGFLVHPAGLVATASHVVLEMGKTPGMEITLYAETGCGPVAIEAEVLFEDQWRGPMWRQWGSKTAALKIPKFIPPTDYLEDTAILRLLLETARPAKREQKLVMDAAAALKSDRYVLPLAPPGFTSGARLKAWHVFWDGSEIHQIRPGDAEYLCTEPGLQHSIRLNDDRNVLGGGYSGSPIWDDSRRRVVGMVRRGIKSSHLGAVLGVDARRIAAAARVALIPDQASSGVIAALRQAAEQLAPMRHFPILQALLPEKLLDLRIRPILPRDPLSENEGAPGRSGIIALREAIERELVVLVTGGSGSGKTTLLAALALDLFNSPLVIDAKRLVPMYLQASDFYRTGFDLEGVLRDQVLRYTPMAAGGRILRDLLRDNDLSLLLLIDGLDEIGSIERAKLSSRFRRGVELAGMRVVLTTRSTEELKFQDGRSGEGWLALEVVALNNQEVRNLTTLLFDDVDKADEFGKILTEIQWDRQGPTPLQIVAAASLFKSLPARSPQTNLKSSRLSNASDALISPQEHDGWLTSWKRAVDLPFLLADHLLELGIQEDAEQRESSGRSRPRIDQDYFQEIENILECLAVHSLDGTPDEDSIVRSITQLSMDWAKDPEGLLRFLKTETTLLGGLIAWAPEAHSENLGLRWSHRTVAEAFAVRGVAKQVKGQTIAGVKALNAMLRKNGQSSAILMLAAMDASPDAAVELTLEQALDRGRANFKQTLFAIRALGAGIHTSQKLRKRLVATLVTLLLLPDNAHLGPLSCSELLSIDDLPNPIDVALRPQIRSAIVEQLHERFSRRMTISSRKSGEIAPMQITARESKMLDRLGMWSDIELPLIRKGHFEGAPDNIRPPNLAGALTAVDTIGAAGLLTFAIQQLQEDADGFLAGFASFVAQLNPETDLSQAGRIYIGELLKRFRER